MNMKHLLLFLLIPALFMINHKNAFSSQENQETGNAFILRANNDFFKRKKNPSSDRRYTHGTSLGWIFNKVPSFLNNKFSFDEKYSSFILNQDIYTPDNTYTSTLLQDEHPYSGELGLIFGLHLKQYCTPFTINDYQIDQQYLLSFELSIGTTGKFSYAGETQKTFHRLTGNAIPQGWENQLPSHVFAKLSIAAKRKANFPLYRDIDLQFIGNIGGDVGNTLVQASCGGEIRVGVNIPDDFGAFAMGAGSIACNIRGTTIKDHKRIGLYLVFLAEGKYVDYNYHIGKRVSPVREIGELGVGWGISSTRVALFNSSHFIIPAFKLNLCYIVRTEEFEEQDGQHRFGSATLAFPWL